MGVIVNYVSRFSINIDNHVAEVPSGNVDKLGGMMNAANRIFLIGNGGSAAICEHISNDLQKRLGKLSPTLSSAEMLTCLANDYGYAQMYVEWLKINRVGKMEHLYKDLLIAISSSGKSPNIINAINYVSLFSDTDVVCISGFDGFPTDICDIDIYFNSNNYGEVEIATEVLLHGIVEYMVGEKV